MFSDSTVSPNAAFPRAEPAIFALIVDAKDDTAVAFTRHHGFRRFASKPASLFLPIAMALQALRAKPGG